MTQSFLCSKCLKSIDFAVMDYIPLKTVYYTYSHKTSTLMGIRLVLLRA